LATSTPNAYVYPVKRDRKRPIGNMRSHPFASDRNNGGSDDDGSDDDGSDDDGRPPGPPGPPDDPGPDPNDDGDLTVYRYPLQEWYVHEDRTELYRHHLCSWSVHTRVADVEGAYSRHPSYSRTSRWHNEVWFAAVVSVGDDFIHVSGTGGQLEYRDVPCRWSNDGGVNTSTLTIPNPDSIRGNYGRRLFMSSAISEIESDGWGRERMIRDLHHSPEGREYLRAWYPHCSPFGQRNLVPKLGLPYLRELFDVPSGDDESTDSDSGCSDV